MRIEDVLWRHGGVASRAALVRATSRAELDAAIRAGSIVRDAHGRYASPHAHSALRHANALTGVVCLRSAASYWRWALKSEPDKVDVLVPRTRKVAAEIREQVTPHWGVATPQDGMVTGPEQTLTDCIRLLPYDEALTVADSALRSGRISRADLVRLAHTVRGPGAVQARLVAERASALAANPFESVLRAICHQVPGLDVEPQVVVIRAPAPKVIPDLVDVARRLVIEAESFEWHGKRGQLRRDCHRLNRLVLDGWVVIRFTWEDVMFRPDYVRSVLEAAVRLTDPSPEHADPAAGRRTAA